MSTGRFVWYELMSKDPAAARAFYTKVAGWNLTPFGEGSDYEMFTAGEHPVGGVQPLSNEAQEAGVPPHWVAYVSVENIDATVSRAESQGAASVMPVMDMEGVGRFTVVRDPQGAALAPFQPTGESHVPGASIPPGYFSWNELYVDDLDAGFDFYAALYGWVESDVMDMGEQGLYRMYKVEGMSYSLGGMMKRPAEMPANCWLHYIKVADLEAAVATVKEEGGQVFVGPMQVPDGGHIAMCMDPEGAMFALHQGARQE